MGLTLRRALTETYYPDLGDNRIKASRGDPDVLAVELTPPTAAVWRRYQSALVTQKIQDARRRGVEFDDGVVSPLDDEAEGQLFVACVGRILSGLDAFEGTAIETGEQLWRLRRVLDRESADPLFTDLLAAILVRARLDAGAIQALAPRSGSPASEAQTDGTVASAGGAA